MAVTIGIKSIKSTKGSYAIEFLDGSGIVVESYDDAVLWARSVFNDDAIKAMLFSWFVEQKTADASTATAVKEKLTLDIALSQPVKVQ
jgi:hypothetical protein